MVPKGMIWQVSNPRYVPREFALHARDFGHKALIEWKSDPSWGPTDLARLDAAHLQHGVAYGVTQLYMPRSNTRTMTSLAEALEVPYPRLRKVLSGHSVMQLEDLGRLRCLIGDAVDPWLLRGRHASLLQEGRAALEREADRHKTDRLRLERAKRWDKPATSTTKPPMR